MESILHCSFVARQLVRDGDLLCVSREDTKRPWKEVMRQWEDELHCNRLTDNDYKNLLTCPHWELNFFPFILAGFRIFNISWCGDPDEDIIPDSGGEVVSIFFKAWVAIQERRLLLENCKSKISLPLYETIIRPKNAVYQKIFEDFCKNITPYPIQIKPARVIEWAILNDIQLQDDLVDILGIYQERPTESLKMMEWRGKKYETRRIHPPQRMTTPQKHEIEYLAAAQILWSRNPGACKSDIAHHPLLKHFGPMGGYTKASKHPFKLLRLIDPLGSHRPKGRGKGAEDSLIDNVLSKPIPGLLETEEGTKKINLKIAKIAYRSYLRAIYHLDDDVSQQELAKNPVINHFFQSIHPIFTTLLNDWRQAEYKTLL